MPGISIDLLPKPLIFDDGKAVAAPAEWSDRRAEILESALSIQYGHLPPTPEKVTGYFLHEFAASRKPEFLGSLYRLTVHPGGLSFLLLLIIPPGQGPFPVIIDGDECWRDISQEKIAHVISRGYALALFNRVEIAPDNMTGARDAGIYAVYPEGDYGALAAWAWGFHRVVDFLSDFPRIDVSKIAVTGHSRGGKTALLAGATDERIALTAPNNSGCGGAGCYRFPDENGETISDILGVVAYWFSKRFHAYLGRENELPFDQHSVKALVAPRALLSTEALGDYWASPRGTRLTYEAAREVYRFLGAESKIGIWYREGGHEHSLPDWEALLDFADLQFYGKPSERDFDMNPFA